MEVRIGCFPVLAFLLTGLFTLMKLTGFIDWSWWWVISPIGFLIAIYVLIFALVFIADITEKR
jgi:hypothetical protein